jgi:glucan phosphoethanolaminetransferase (alkaline phosphatase superfamily)
VIAALVLATFVTVWFVRRQQKKMRQDLDSILQTYMPISDSAKGGEQQDEAHQNLVPSTDSTERV